MCMWVSVRLFRRVLIRAFLYILGWLVGWLFGRMVSLRLCVFRHLRYIFALSHDFLTPPLCFSCTPAALGRRCNTWSSPLPPSVDNFACFGTCCHLRPSFLIFELRLGVLGVPDEARNVSSILYRWERITYNLIQTGAAKQMKPERSASDVWSMKFAASN